MQISLIKENVISYYKDRKYTVLSISNGVLHYGTDKTLPAPGLAFVMKGGDIIFIDLVASLTTVEDGSVKYTKTKKAQKAFNKAGSEYHVVAAKNLGSAIEKITDILSGHASRCSIGALGKGAAESRIYYNV